MKNLLIDKNSISEAAAEGLPFCGTDETSETNRAMLHLIAEAEKKADGAQCILTADRDLFVLCTESVHILYVSFDNEGSHIDLITEPISADQLALSGFIGEESARAILELYGTLSDIFTDIDKVSFFGAEKIIRDREDDIKKRYDELSSLSVDELISEGILEEADSVDIEAPVEQEEKVDYGNERPVFITDYSDSATLSELVLTAKDCLDGNVRLVFSDIKDTLHKLGHEAGFDFEIRKGDVSGIHEEENGQLSLFKSAGNETKENETAGALYNVIMDIERRAWQESQDEDISYGSALHRYVDDCGIENYIIDPLDQVRPQSAAELMTMHKKAADHLSGTKEGSLYVELELPLIFVLYDMEKTGIYMDADRLRDYGSQLAGHIDELEQKIYEEAGETFNINSPKQLGEILFGKLHLPKGKKTKTGYSTSQKVLDELSTDYPIVNDVLAYRKYAKLKSTYADGLYGCVACDGRVHTTYQQTVTATGRLSSTDPNLQNIPIRIELGKQIRKVFLPAENSEFLDADYSQIELRVLAHMSGDENLIEAYKADRDIHTATAAAVFHVSPDEVTPLMRRSAKAVNFGIVYGISSFGLGQNLSISRAEAQQYINDYFKAYPGLHSFLDGLVDSAKIHGYAETMYGRRRPVPELKDSAYMRRQFGERVAMNAPIQGTAADIIKIAMLHVFIRLRKENMKSKLLLQVHDELLIEAPSDEKEEAAKILKEEMENAANLKVPLEVDLKEGRDWYSAH